MGFLSGITSHIGDIVGTVGGVASTLLGNNSAKHEAERNRDWQEEMSNTSIQRRMADLKAAGLNPLLAVSSASSGASTPTGAQAQLKHFDPTTITTFINGLASAKLTQAQATAQEQENSLFETKADSLRLKNRLLREGVLNAQVERELNQARTFGEIERALTEGYKRANLHVSTDKIRNEATLLGITKEYYESGIADGDFLRKYPGYVQMISSKNSSTFPSTLGFFGSGLATGSAKMIGKLKTYFENNKNNNTFERKNRTYYVGGRK